jgi:hypothetical protein
VIHDDGLGEPWYDCKALNTYGSAQATLACQAHDGAAATCTPIGCQGGGSNSVVCDVANPGSATGVCNCWNYTGTNVGHVFHGTSGCFCPTTLDAQWH